MTVPSGRRTSQRRVGPTADCASASKRCSPRPRAPRNSWRRRRPRSSTHRRSASRWAASSTRISCCRGSARAVWAKSIARAIRGSIATSRSKSSRTLSRPMPTGSRDSSARRSCSLPSIIRTSARSTASKTARARHALVLELVEGATLADRIAQGPLPLDEALPIARQIADALESAHEQRVIHRDLKPANIKLRPDGTVKVLDFGLAKAFDPGARRLPTSRHDSRGQHRT